MHISDEGLNLIKRFEGLRLESYKDAVGVWTIGYGHTNGVTGGMKISQAQADELLRADVSGAENAVNKYHAIYNFNLNQYSALVSFTYNCGVGNLKKLVNGGLRTKEQISDALLLYCKAGGKELKGLKVRRKAEQDLFNK